MRRRLFAVAAASAVLVVMVALAVGRGASGILERGPGDRPWVALTFDADPSGYDPRIVRTLRRTETPATIFVTGHWAEGHADVVRELAADPLFELESHGHSHAAFTAGCYDLPAVTTRDAKQQELAQATAVLTRLTGVAPRYFRFPGGCFEDGDLGLVAAYGQVPVQWDVVSGDSYEHDPAAVARAVVEGARPGSIVVMHLNGAPSAPATAEALDRVIPELRRRGLRLVTPRELLAPRD
jgi:peptidoglycan-N-acetylglucosamine deacetylase